ncbi:hypothetical protein F442_21563 [Phytophthora nicotianae P10297]|uniref:Uncharacterized protein n=1 Tax=Phytophthora nicotianae P10297 TaxID=1317064 RepID=W2Y2T3_PHYNI|nr:hypothetical protein F442_21563 [Phytophthora nicotianae P10297]
MITNKSFVLRMSSLSWPGSGGEFGLIWFWRWALWCILLAAQIAHAKYKRLIRNHAQKFCSKLKYFGSGGKKDQLSSVSMLLLVQNEVGQIVARGLARSENQDESATILRLVVPLLDKQTTPAPVCVCDDANETRGMVAKVFGANVKTMQEPYSRNTVIAEKLIDKPERKALTQKLSSALYDVAGNIRSPEAMASDCLSVLRDVKLSSILMGDLYVKENEYLESGKRIRVLSPVN